MPKQPSRFKYPKFHKSSTISRVVRRQFKQQSSSIAICSLEAGRIPSATIESMEKTISKILKDVLKEKGFTLLCRCYPHSPITKKPAEVRMGGGKGSVDYFSANIEAGQILFEINDVSNINEAVKSCECLNSKSPVKILVIPSVTL
jgi:large subunit ribosomal protein L16